jgi:hypothetical protein
MTTKKLISTTIACVLLSITASCQSYSVIPNTITSTSNNTTTTENKVVSSTEYKNDIANALSENDKEHESSDDYNFEQSNSTLIALNGSSISVTGNGAVVNGSKVTINSSGTYSISGNLTDGQILVDAKEEDTIKIILNGINISNSNTSPFYISKSKKTILMLADSKENIITDSKTYIFPNKDEDEPNASLFSKSDLTIFGKGSLTVNGNYNDAIASKDGLIIKSGNITVNALDDAIRGKDYIVIKDANLKIDSKGDALKSDNDEDKTKGYISIESGNINITSAKDAITAKTDVLIKNGAFTISSGGGSSIKPNEETSSKGIKGLVNTIIDNGTFNLDSSDDTIHSNNNVVINGGTLNLSSGDDAIHSDEKILINNGTIDIKKSYEGIESKSITINSGNIHLISSDDGINGADGSATQEMGMGRPRGGAGGSSNVFLYINGGYLFVNANGDGLDSNGSVEMKGGTVIVDGPIANNNGAIDYDGSFKITGGFLLAAGSSRMAQIPDINSTQNSTLITFSSVQNEKTLVHLQDSKGNTIFSYSPSKKYQSIAFSSPELKKDESYDIFLGGTSTGSLLDGLYKDGIYTAGTKYKSFNISTVSTKITG